MRPPLNDIDKWPITAGWRYSSGAGHFAYDYDSDTGTPAYAVGDGTILASADGVPNDRPNYPGEPSNWILLGIRWKGRRVSVLYQHLSPGLKVHTGMHVKEGHHIDQAQGEIKLALEAWWANGKRRPQGGGEGRPVIRGQRSVENVTS